MPTLDFCNERQWHSYSLYCFILLFSIIFFGSISQKDCFYHYDKICKKKGQSQRKVWKTELNFISSEAVSLKYFLCQVEFLSLIWFCLYLPMYSVLRLASVLRMHEIKSWPLLLSQSQLQRSLAWVLTHVHTVSCLLLGISDLWSNYCSRTYLLLHTHNLEI